MRHSLELLRKEKDSAEKIVQVTQERQGEGFELPVEVTKAQLTRAQVVERILQLEGRQDELEVFLRNQLGLAPEQTIEVTAEDLPGAAEQEGANLIAMASEINPSIAFADSDVKAQGVSSARRKARLLADAGTGFHLQRAGEIQLQQLHQHHPEFPVQQLECRRERQHADLQFKNTGQCCPGTGQSGRLPKSIWSNTRKQVSAEVRQKSRKVQQADAAKEVARLELQLAQQNVAVLQSQFGEGKTNLRDVESARLDENEKWMAYLDANFRRQQAQLELLKTAGQLERFCNSRSLADSTGDCDVLEKAQFENSE